MTKRYILTGTPGCGKTSILKALQLKGYSVINEAATDVIAIEQSLGNMEPWTKPDFIDKIVELQKRRQVEAISYLVFSDRSPICTYALAVYLGFESSRMLMEEIDRILSENIYEMKVFFIENLGFIEATEARKISFEESLKFEKIHEEAYEMFGFQLVRIKPASIQERVEEILKKVNNYQVPS